MLPCKVGRPSSLKTAHIWIWNHYCSIQMKNLWSWILFWKSCVLIQIDHYRSHLIHLSEGWTDDPSITKLSSIINHFNPQYHQPVNRPTQYREWGDFDLFLVYISWSLTSLQPLSRVIPRIYDIMLYIPRIYYIMQVHFTFFPFFTAAIAVRNVRASILRQMNFHQYEHFISRRKYLYHSSNNTGVTLLIKCLHGSSFYGTNVLWLISEVVLLILNIILWTFYFTFYLFVLWTFLLERPGHYDYNRIIIRFITSW